MNRSIFFRILLTLVLLGVMAGLGVFAYNAGMAHGLAQTAQAAGGDGTKGLYPPYPYYGMPFAHPFGFGGFGFLGCLIPLFLLCLFFSVMRALIWHGPHGWGHHGWHRHGMGGWDEGVPERVQEWHRQMHEKKPEEPDVK